MLDDAQIFDALSSAYHSVAEARSALDRTLASAYHSLAEAKNALDLALATLSPRATQCPCGRRASGAHTVDHVPVCLRCFNGHLLAHAQKAHADARQAAP